MRDADARGVARGVAVDPVVVDAHRAAEEVLAAARAEARALLEAARREVEAVRAGAAAEGRAAGAATLAAREVELAARVARADERALDRTIELATLLAERLLGEALALAPDRVVALARQILAEARGAQRVRLVAHPADAVVLTTELGALGMPEGALEVAPSDERARGSVRLETDVGVIDGELAPQLARLAAALRAALAGERGT